MNLTKKKMVILSGYSRKLLKQISEYRLFQNTLHQRCIYFLLSRILIFPLILFICFYSRASPPADIVYSDVLNLQKKILW
jgi:hypothetical protein